jgi:PTH1 family peptidyl-tRNA hydrolase
MLLIVGLGNPGAEYARQRHNVGFMAVDVIYARHKFTPWRRRFRGEVAEGTLAGAKVLLLKPITFMNDSGDAVQEAAHFYKLAPKDIVVIHDEVDLPAGKVRLKAGGGSAGHNGLRSITAAIGDEYRRVRIGVGHPGRKEAVPHYVLHDFAKADTAWLVPLLDAIGDNADLLAEGKDATFANRIHAALAPPEKEKAPKDTAKPRAPSETPSGDVVPAAKPPTAAKPASAPSADAAPKGDGPLASALKKLFGRG